MFTGENENHHKPRPIIDCPHSFTRTSLEQQQLHQQNETKRLYYSAFAAFLVYQRDTCVLSRHQATQFDQFAWRRKSNNDKK